MTPTVTLIVPVFEQWDLVPDLVDAIEKQKYRPENFEAIFVENGSGNFENHLSLPNWAKVLFCESPGSYAARNKGLESAKGELIIFTDADCVPSDCWIKVLLDSYQNMGDDTLFAGQILVRSKKKKPNIAELHDIVSGLPQGRYVSRGYAVTANLAIPRKIFDVVGNFDERRFSGGDADFCKRALFSGYHLKYVPEAIVYHPARASWHESVTKVRRVKGGQIKVGNLSRKLKYGFITFVPPFWRLWRILINGQLDIWQKIGVCGFQSILWLVELGEMFLLLLGKKPERR